MPLPASQPWGFFFSRKSKGTKTLKVKKLKKTFKSWQKEIPVFLMAPWPWVQVALENFGVTHDNHYQ